MYIYIYIMHYVYVRVCDPPNVLGLIWAVVLPDARVAWSEQNRINVTAT